MITLRPYQQQAVDSINNFFRQGLGNPVIVAPTGSGKSVMIASYVEQIISSWSDTRFVILAHVKELLEQNFKALKKLCPDIDCGLYSAGLKRRDVYNSVIVAGIQSVYNKAEALGWLDLCIVDESHLINPKQMGRYREFIDAIRVKNPNLKVIGFTATPYRLGHGYIHKGEQALFDGIAHQIDVEEMIKEGYLVYPKAKNGKVHADLSDVHVRAGEYVESEAAEAFSEITLPAVQDVLIRAKGRKCGLVFCTGLKHAQTVKDAFILLGEYSVEMVSGSTSAKERARLVDAVKSGSLRWLINVAVFTTGFDAPNIDTIVFLRATQSTGLYVQMVGRGLRPASPELVSHPSKGVRLLAIASSVKPDCLVLDYGQNVERHGPLNSLTVRDTSDGKKTDSIRAKDCPACEELIAINARECPSCGYEFPVDERGSAHGTEAAEVDLLQNFDPYWVDVESVNYSKHEKLNKKPSMRVDYHVAEQILPISEWVCFDHAGYAAKKAAKWAKKHGAQWMSVDRALEHNWPKPVKIKIKRCKHSTFMQVLDYQLEVLEL